MLTLRYSFTVGCRTEDGFTVILVERGEGVETKPIKTSYVSAQNAWRRVESNLWF